MNKKVGAAGSHHERKVAELREERELAIEYLKAAMESLDDPDNRAQLTEKTMSLLRRREGGAHWLWVTR